MPCPNTHTSSLYTEPLDYLYDVFPVFVPSVQVRMKTTSVCRTFHYLMGHTYSVVKMQVFKCLHSFIFILNTLHFKINLQIGLSVQ